MSRAIRKSAHLGFSYLQLEGGLFVPDHLAKAVASELDFQKADDYEILPGLKLGEEISRFFQIAQGQWGLFDARRKRDDHDPMRATEEFVRDLLGHAFGFGPIERIVPVTIGDRSFPVGHMARGRVAVVIAPHNQELDEPDARFAIAGTGTRRKSPFQLAQEFLNASEGHLWAVVTNGRQLRLLRDSAALTRPVWLEVDLEQILTARDWAAFTACWRLFHGSRAGKADAAPDDCIWERWRKMGQETGLRVRDSLRQGVQEALLALGTGFLQATENGALRQAILSNELSEKAYFDELLHLIYRFLFIFAVEERELLHPENGSADAQKLYLEGYSQKRLRDRCLRPGASSTHHDLWEGQRIVWKALEAGEAALGLPALGGLFASSQCPHLDNSCLSNAALLSALRALRWSGKTGSFASVDYRNMGPEELGSVYESLLELVPRVDLEIRSFGFVGIGDTEGSTKGNARKTSGSYYTPDSLVQELLKTSLDPVIADRLAQNPADPIGALLGLRIIDTSCGSGHFLLAAARRVAERLAQAQHPDGAVSPADYRHALRDVISHCIFGVDRNPMAVELARTALWLESFEAERPLSFLDHHLVCGDALLGLMDLKVLELPIPDKAFVALSGDDKLVCKDLSKQNKDAAKVLIQQQDSSLLSMDLGGPDPLESLGKVDELPDNTLDQVAAKFRAYEEALHQARRSTVARMADAWVGAFLIPKTEENREVTPTTRTLVDVRYMGSSRHETHRALQAAQLACLKARVLHWPLAFPGVLSKGGFDVVLGNPPWDMLQLDPQEFFSTKAPDISAIKNMASREKAIEELKSTNVVLFNEYSSEIRLTEAVQSFVHASERFRLSGRGRINLSSLFAETCLNILSKTGRAGIITPAGISTDSFTQHLWGYIANGRLISLTGFDNQKRIFPAVHPDTPFVLLTMGENNGPIQLCNYILSVEELLDPRRRYSLSNDDFRLVNPNTLTCPIFRSQVDANLAKQIYGNVPVLIREADEVGDLENPWGISFQLMFMMNTDSRHFRDHPESDSFPLLEAKMMHQFDHRWATHRGQFEDQKWIVETEDVFDSQKYSPDFSVTPRYWVNERNVFGKSAKVPNFLSRAWNSNDEHGLLCAIAVWVAASCPDISISGGGEESIRKRVIAAGGGRFVALPIGDEDWLGVKDLTEARIFEPLTNAELEMLKSVASITDIVRSILLHRVPRWLMGWRDIANATNERTLIASVVQYAAVGNNMPLIRFGDDIPATKCAAFLGNLCALVLDFVVRNKVGGTHLNFFIVKQLPILPPTAYSEADLAYIVPRVLELTYTAWDLKGWAEDLGFTGAPFRFDPDRRAVLRAELDARYARLYGLTRDELRYILDPSDVMGPEYPTETFRVLKNREMSEFGEYRTRRLVLEAWDREEGNG